MRQTKQNHRTIKAMQRSEAAAFLGVSISTLDRLASQGRLTRGRAKRKTRPVTVYDEGELRTLKQELGEGRGGGSFRRLNADRPQDAVGFRLDPFYVERLRSEGGKHGMSPGEYARRLVIRGLEETASARYAEELGDLRSSLSGMFYLILMEKFGTTEEEANHLVAALTR